MRERERARQGVAVKAETMLRNLGAATREGVYAIADGTGGGRNERLVLYRAFALAVCYDAFRMNTEEKIALTKMLQSFVEGEAGERKFCVACDATRTLLSDPSAKCKVHGAPDA